MIPETIIEDYEALRSAILYKKSCPTLEGIILNHQGMLKWCCERGKRLNEQFYSKRLTELPSIIREEKNEPLIHAIVNMINYIYEGEHQNGEYARC